MNEERFLKVLQSYSDLDEHLPTLWKGCTHTTSFNTTTTTAATNVTTTFTATVVHHRSYCLTTSYILLTLLLLSLLLPLPLLNKLLPHHEILKLLSTTVRECNTISPNIPITSRQNMIVIKEDSTHPPILLPQSLKTKVNDSGSSDSATK